MKPGTQNKKKNEGGFITFDFIFALLMALGFTTILFSMAVTLSAVEVAQYITFAVSRAYTGAHETDKDQEQLAKQKYAELIAVPILKRVFNGGWFTIGPIEVGDYNREYNDDAESPTFIGARLKMDAKILRMTIPFLGRTAEKTETGRATLNSYLNREVTTTECRENFNRVRFDQLKNLSVYKGAAEAKAKLITDNGC